MRILIIGGTGNISTAVTRLLLSSGNDITLFNRGSGTIPGTGLIKGDRTDTAGFREKIVQAGDFDCVYDMICYSPGEARTAVDLFSGRTNQYIFCSTVDVYTKPAEMYPVSEDFERNPSPDFRYAYDKALCERIFEEADEKGLFHSTIMRPAATYNDASTPISPVGSGMYCLKRIKQGKPVIILGDGTSLWTSSHRDDVAQAFANAAGNEKTYGKAYNITGGEAVSWLGYYGSLAKHLGAGHIEPVYITADLLAKIAPRTASWSEMNFKYSNVFDNSLAVRDLGYRYTVSWDEGAARMVRTHEKANSIDSCPDDGGYDEIISRYNSMRDEMISSMAGLNL